MPSSRRRAEIACLVALAEGAKGCRKGAQYRLSTQTRSPRLRKKPIFLVHFACTVSGAQQKRYGASSVCIWSSKNLPRRLGKSFSRALGTPLRPAETPRPDPTATSCCAHGLLDAYATALRPYYLITSLVFISSSTGEGDIARSGPPGTTRLTAHACASGKREPHQARARGSGLPAHAFCIRLPAHHGCCPPSRSSL